MPNVNLIVQQSDTSKRIFLSPPHMGGDEIRFVQDAFYSNYIAPVGPQVDAFEKEFTEKVGISHAVALSSGTAAMHLALRYLGVGPGDEVFASTLTFIGSISPIVLQGATPVLIDSDRSTWNMDPELLENELYLCAKEGRLPKAVVPTDLYGQCCDLPRIIEACDRYGVPVVCDSAEAMGAKYRSAECSVLSAEDKDINKKYKMVHAGVGADAAVFSFNGNKIITSSGGGMLASENKDLIEKTRFLSQQAKEPFPHYEHSELGYNYRMSNVVAAIGRGQMLCLESRVQRKREIFDYYQAALKDVPGIEFMPEAPYGACSRWLTVVLIDSPVFGADRETVRLALEAKNIESRPVWKPMHMQPVFRVRGQESGVRSQEQGARSQDSRIQGSEVHSSQFTVHRSKRRYPVRVIGGEVSEKLFDKGLCLPSGTAMTNSDLDRVIETIMGCRKK